MSSAAAELALTVLDGAFQGKAWQGPTLTGSLRGVKPALALWRPDGVLRCIWEQVLHATYWKLTILRVLDPATKLRLLRPGGNWPRPSSGQDAEPAAAWKADLDRLKEVHAALRAAVVALPEQNWRKRPRTPASAGSRSMNYAQYLAGAAAHDAYHTGQIRYIKRLHAARRNA